jgi:hypothetical protein
MLPKASKHITFRADFSEVNQLIYCACWTAHHLPVTIKRMDLRWIDFGTGEFSIVSLQFFCVKTCFTLDLHASICAAVIRHKRRSAWLHVAIQNTQIAEFLKFRISYF